MEIAVRQSSLERSRAGHDVKKCPQCRAEALVMLRRHVSPPRWGTPVVTEYYDCEYCEASYQFSPADNRWRPIYH
jgi:hypothetical protein